MEITGVTVSILVFACSTVFDSNLSTCQMRFCLEYTISLSSLLMKMFFIERERKRGEYVSNLFPQKKEFDTINLPCVIMPLQTLMLSLKGKASIDNIQ